MNKFEEFKKEIFRIIQIGNRKDLKSKIFDIFIVIVICVNLFVTLFSTFDSSIKYENILNYIEFFTIVVFTIEYGLRIWTAEYLYPKKNKLGAIITFVFSFYGIIDLLTFLPYFLPIIFPSGIIAFRMLRVFRIFRLFQINSHYDAFNVIINVLNEKKNQLFSSICLILILMIASSLCMYSLEHTAQPDKFENAFSGIWWSVSTLLTVGYGDIYPITLMGKIMAIIISFLGVGMVAIPTGIISAGFVEQYTKLKTIAYSSEETDIKFITINIDKKSIWKDTYVRDIKLPNGLIMALILRDDDVIIPRGDTLINLNDKVILGAETFSEDLDISLKEIEIKEENPWVGEKIKDLDISRRTLIVMIRRKGKVIIPNGETIIKDDDELIMFSKIKKKLGDI